ncbi:MAG: HAD-IA family hydrolase [Chloroflexi bacterium]|nr:HAD-IA family hydrolase [Chloroflexota bacterium]
MPPKAVFFDMDGVLLESFDAWLSVLNAAATVFGYPPVSKEAFRAIFGGPTQADVDTFFPKHTMAEVDAFYTANFAIHAAAATALPGASRVLDELDAQGVPTAVITNTHSAIARPLLESLGLIPHALIAADNVENPKPAPDMIFRACEVLDVEPWDVLVVGDSVFDQQAAAAAGVPFAGFGGIAGNFTISRLEDVLALVDGSY